MLPCRRILEEFPGHLLQNQRPDSFLANTDVYVFPLTFPSSYRGVTQ